MNQKFEDAESDFEQKRKVITPIHFVTKSDLPPITEEDDIDTGSEDTVVDISSEDDYDE